MILSECGIARRLGLSRAVLKSLRKNGPLQKRTHWTIESKNLLYTPAGAALLLQTLGLPADALDEKTAPMDSLVSGNEPLAASPAAPEKTAPPAGTIWTLIRLNPINWTLCTARNGAGEVAMIRHGWPEAEARRMIPGRTTMTCRFMGGQWQRIPGLDRMPPLRPGL